MWCDHRLSTIYLILLTTYFFTSLMFISQFGMTFRYTEFTKGWIKHFINGEGRSNKIDGVISGGPPPGEFRLKRMFIPAFEATFIHDPSSSSSIFIAYFKAIGPKYNMIFFMNSIETLIHWTMFHDKHSNLFVWSVGII